MLGRCGFGPRQRNLDSPFFVHQTLSFESPMLVLKTVPKPSPQKPFCKTYPQESVINTCPLKSAVVRNPSCAPQPKSCLVKKPKPSEMRTLFATYPLQINPRPPFRNIIICHLKPDIWRAGPGAPAQKLGPTDEVLNAKGVQWQCMPNQWFVCTDAPTWSRELLHKHKIQVGGASSCFLDVSQIYTVTRESHLMSG